MKFNLCWIIFKLVIQRYPFFILHHRPASSQFEQQEQQIQLLPDLSNQLAISISLAG